MPRIGPTFTESRGAHNYWYITHILRYQYLLNFAPPWSPLSFPITKNFVVHIGPGFSQAAPTLQNGVSSRYFWFPIQFIQFHKDVSPVSHTHATIIIIIIIIIQQLRNDKRLGGSV